MKNSLSCLRLAIIGMMAIAVIASAGSSDALAQEAGSAAGTTLDQTPPPDLAASAAFAPSTQPPQADLAAPAADSQPAANMAADSGMPPSLSDSLANIESQRNPKPQEPVDSGSVNSDGTAAAESQGIDLNSQIQGTQQMGVDSPALDLDSIGFEDPNAVPKKTEAELENEMRARAFKAAIEKALPMRPAEIRRMLELYDETVQATETPIYPDPDPESSFVTASLDPGTKPVTVKAALGNVTTVSIVDITGQPWPIQDLTWAGDFQVEQPEAGSHMLRITPTSKFATGNVSLRLIGLNPPVIFSLRTERKTVHVRLDVQIPEVGPKGIVPPVDTPVATRAGNDFMTSVLTGGMKSNDGVNRMKVEGVDGRTTAYDQGNMIYVRTPYTMLSPAWSQSVQSADGTKVYALDYTPVILLSDKGKMVKAYLSRKEQSDGEY